MFGDIPVRRMTVTVPKASAKRFETNRRLVIEGHYIHWDEPQQTVHVIPDGADTFEFDFKDESDSDSIPDENEVLFDGPLDGRIYYSFYIEFHNATDTRKERVEVTPTEQL